jgi:L-fucose mutarotase
MNGRQKEILGKGTRIMLKGIPRIISPELMKVLMEMGHEDEIVFVDGNFPATRYANRLIRIEVQDMAQILDAVLKFFPLDFDSKFPVTLMEVENSRLREPIVIDDYERIIKKYNPEFQQFELLEKYKFYERAKNAYAIVATNEQALYENIVLRKGIIID